jgi:hypothetical protein
MLRTHPKGETSSRPAKMEVGRVGNTVEGDSGGLYVVQPTAVMTLYSGELPVSLSGPIANPTTRRFDFCSLVLSQLDSKLQ